MNTQILRATRVRSKPACLHKFCNNVRVNDIIV